MYILANEIPDGVAILLMFVALLVTVGLGFLFFWLIKRNMEKEKEESEVIIEDADIGSRIIQQLQKEGFCPISFNPEGSKQVRATCVTKLIRDGRVRLLKDAIWLQDFAKEVRAFPYGAHDDQIDALVQLLTEFEKGTFASSSGVYIIDSCFSSHDNDIDDLYQELFDDFKRENPDWS